MSNAGRDDKGLQGLDGDEFSVEFHLCVRLAFEDDVGFGESFVVVAGGLFADLGDMQCTGEFGNSGKRAACGSAGAGDAGNLGEVCGSPATGWGLLTGVSAGVGVVARHSAVSICDVGGCKRNRPAADERAGRFLAVLRLAILGPLFGPGGGPFIEECLDACGVEVAGDFEVLIGHQILN